MAVRRTLMLSVILAVAVGCQSPSRPAPASPVAASQVARFATAPAPADSSALLQRFSRTIWPAINDMNMLNLSYDDFYSVLDKNLDNDQWMNVLFAVRRLGGSFGDDPDAIRLTDLALAKTTVTALNPPDATLNICYAYEVNASAPHAAAAQATVGLHQDAGVWYLHSLTDDHVVPSC